MSLSVRHEVDGGDEQCGRVALDHKGSDGNVEGVEGCWYLGTRKSSCKCPQHKLMQLYSKLKQLS